MNKTWPFSFYFWQYLSVGFVMPFLVFYYQSLGFSGGQIGLLAGLSPLITLFFAPLWTGLADSKHRHGLVMSVCMLVSIAALALYPMLSTFLGVLIAITVYSIFVAPVSSLADSATIQGLGDDRALYGRLRLGGTFGFALGSPLAGLLVQNYGLKWAFWGGAGLFALAWLCSLMFVKGAANEAAASQPPIWKGLGVLLSRPRFRLFLCGAFIGGFALSVTNNYFFPYMKELGADQTSMGLALSLGTVCEVPVMFFGHRLLGYFKSYRLYMIGLALSGVRLVLLFLAGNPLQAMLIQVLLGATFPAMWIAGVAYADENAPAGLSASAQGIFGAVVFGVGTGLGGFVGGALLESLGARGMCLAFGVMTLAVVGVIFLVGLRMAPAPAKVEA